MKITRILLPVDGSRHSDTATEMAMELAGDANISVVLLHVRKTVPTGLGEPNAIELLEYLNKEAENIMAHYRAKLSATNAQVTELIVGGKVAEVICNVAEVEKCDIIVMGSRGKSDFEGLILGSATHKVLHTTDIPVLVVK
ncbi:universal stress protein [Pseudodesulfovibrio sediminis]|uniref:Universal stress protein n=1 Tax=Pseudodesulfovibrio sediminis TaxID=2810563 RepID=A0ABM7P7Z5_9BACT|nr:universal stress protein [Pseudodesulfovibrio sediminis]BCS89098.1 universal stress protein [Pseudodesulfovibrio sediminis]